MNKLSALCLAGTMLTASSMAMAWESEDGAHSTSASVALATDYVWRGYSQTDEEAAISGSFDYGHSSGLYAGVWASNVDFEDADLVEEANPEFSPSAFMFFSSPNQPVEWNVPKMWSGYYIQIDRQIINANKHLFFNFMGYGLHEGLYLTENEKNQIEQLLAQLYQVYHQENYSKAITLSYCHLVFSYIEYFYKRQFKTKKDAHNRLVKLFISELNEFYPSLSQKKFGTPTVQFFASKLNTTPNYLGDVVRNITGLSPIEHIHQTIIKEAKALLKQGIYSNSEIAYHLGFEYPNYFSRLFKKLEGISPTEFKGK